MSRPAAMNGQSSRPHSRFSCALSRHSFHSYTGQAPPSVLPVSGPGFFRSRAEAGVEGAEGVPTACCGGVASRLLLFVPIPAARASVLVTMPRTLVALMPLAIVEHLAHTAAGRIGPVLEGSCAGARGHRGAPLCTSSEGGRAE